MASENSEREISHGEVPDAAGAAPATQIMHLSLHGSYKSWLELRNSLIKPVATDDAPVSVFLLRKFNNCKSDVCVGTLLS